MMSLAYRSRFVSFAPGGLQALYPELRIHTLVGEISATLFLADHCPPETSYCSLRKVQTHISLVRISLRGTRLPSIQPPGHQSSIPRLDDCALRTKVGGVQLCVELLILNANEQRDSATTFQSCFATSCLAISESGFPRREASGT